MNNILLIGNLVKEPEKVNGQELCKLNKPINILDNMRNCKIC